jgi:hypothetical protein
MINIEGLQNYILDNQMFSLFLVFILFISIYYFSEKSVLILILFIGLFYLKDNMIDEINKNTSKIHKNIIEDNIRTKRNINIHKSIQSIIDELSIYKKYNRISYKQGIKKIQMFSLLISDLEKDDIYDWKQYYENAKLYLKNSVNDFQSISYSVPEESYSDSLKYNKNSPSKIQTEIGQLTKKLYLNGNHLLINISEKLNQKYEKDINMYHSPVINHNVSESNSFTNNYDLF